MDNVPGTREEALPPRESRVICCREGEVCSHVCRSKDHGPGDRVEASGQSQWARAIAEG